MTRFGQVLNAQAGPRQPVLHFKLPMAVAADTICISTDTVKMPVMTAFTRDTQEVSLQLSTCAANRGGRAGNVDISHNLESVANDRVRVSRQDVTALAGGGRETIVDDIEVTIASELKRLFKIEVQDVKIPALDFSVQQGRREPRHPGAGATC